MLSAVIPAAGKGTRLRPLTDYIPKELLILKNKPILGYILETLKFCGIKDVCIVVGHKKGEIIDYVKDGRDFDLNVCYIYQRDTLGLGHAISITEDYIKNNFFVVFLGDTVILPMQSIKKMIDDFVKKHKDKDGALLVEKVENPERFGVVRFNSDNVIEEVYEKPKSVEVKNRFRINGGYFAISGVYILNKKIYSYLNKTPPGANNEIQLTDAIKMAIEDGRKFIAYIQEGIRLDIGTYDSYEEAQRKILSFEKGEL